MCAVGLLSHDPMANRRKSVPAKFSAWRCFEMHSMLFEVFLMAIDNTVQRRAQVVSQRFRIRFFGGDTGTCLLGCCSVGADR